MDRVEPEQRTALLRKAQEFLVAKVGEYHKQQRLKPVFDPSKTKAEFVAALLGLAREQAKSDAVAQYLVGAKLQVRFPDQSVRNESYSTADQQGGRAGDFEISNTVFHITVSPSAGHFDKCQRNLQAGLRPYVVVPSGMLEGARQNAEHIAPGQIAVVSIESFIAQNIDELGRFDSDASREQLRSLLVAYNVRVDAVENDKSLLIDIPPNL
ncbi:MAG: DUF4928 family protein [Acidobacteriia bacterium]|nr:DUF4928 family protein [Terriglobia bacterium]